MQPAIRSSPIPPRWLLAPTPEPPVLDWRERLVCSRCGGRQADMVVTGPSGVARPLACAHRRQNQSRNARRSLRLRRAIARYRASNAANEQHHPGPGDHH
jgi:hypothetical protein